MTLVASLDQLGGEVPEKMERVGPPASVRTGSRRAQDHVQQQRKWVDQLPGRVEPGLEALGLARSVLVVRTDVRLDSNTLADKDMACLSGNETG
ncbi:hypothetical protein IFM62136_06493 [Aspergillus lentulus]|nr:hypothetical protein IFM62136_06493 [Aspergillus lentulus]